MHRFSSLPVEYWIPRKHPQSPLVAVFRFNRLGLLSRGGSGVGVAEAEAEAEEKDDDAEGDGEHDEVAARVQEVAGHFCSH